MSKGKMGINATWSMAVGGMIGGGIFSVLGVVASVSGPMFPLSFLIGGAIALGTAWSYTSLVKVYGEGGGAFTFLRREGLPAVAGILAWILVLGYTLTMSVYAYTFSAYLVEAVGATGIAGSLAAVSIVAVLTTINLGGVRQSARVEIISVWGKVLILLGLGVIGIVHWEPAALSDGGRATSTLGGAFVGASAVFMAYEGFQLLSYDYDDIADPERTLRVGLLTSVASVIAIYVVVSVGAVMLTGLGTIIEHREVALAIAGERAAGTVGRWIVTLAAALSTASAINATLFATARLAHRVARANEMPQILTRENSQGIPSVAVVSLGVGSAVLAVVTELSRLVEAASLTFLLTFATVNAIAARRVESHRWIPVAAGIGSVCLAVALALRVAGSAPWTLAALAAVVGVATTARGVISARGT